MFTTILASLSVLVALQTSESPSTLQSFTVTTAPKAVSIVTAATGRDNEHLEAARKAMQNGDFDIARREFAAAAAIERDAGRLPVEAVHGLAHALYSQAYSIEAAVALEKLAGEASARGDVNSAALALADAIWLNSDAGQRVLARKQCVRLRQLMRHADVSDATRHSVRSRVG